MRFGQGSRKTTPIWAWSILFGAVELVLPGAAFVGAQEVADFSKPRTEPMESGNPTLESPSDEKGEVRNATVTVDDIGAPARRTKPAGNASVDLSSSAYNHPARAPSPQMDGANPNSDPHDHERRVPVMGAITWGGPATAFDPPSDAEVMQARECVGRQKSSPGFGKSHREGVRIIKEKIADYVDPPRFYPLIGTAQLHHAHYKCTIYFTERPINDLPCKAEVQDAVEVIYIDHNHFHMPSKPKTDSRP